MKYFIAPLLLAGLLACHSGNKKNNAQYLSANDTSQLNDYTKELSVTDSSITKDISATDSPDINRETNGNTATIQQTGSTHFGVIVNKTDGSSIGPPGQAKIAKALGLHYIRSRISMEKWNGSDDGMDVFKSEGLHVVLNINYVTASGAPVPFPTDLESYKQKLSSILTKYQPALVTIENEEDNKGYHSGTAEDYINELKVGIEVAHSKGLKVTNGGITSPMMVLLVYDDLVSSGRKDDAYKFASKAFPDARLARLNELANKPYVEQKLAEGKKLINAYKSLNLDYVNFHWYLPLRGIKGAEIAKKIDPILITYVADYIKRKTGKPAITTEIGQLDPSPAIVSNTLKTCFDLKMPYVIWYSGDGGEGKAVALQNAQGDLRENGQAFKTFIQNNNAGN